jgi:uncharacterized lipoprotein YajG
MSFARIFVFATSSAVLLAACAGQPQTYQMNPGQSVTVRKGTMTDAASVGDANALAQMIVNDNNYDQAQLGGS